MDKSCCFFGHRDPEITNELKSKLYDIIKKLIVEENTETFLFGSKSRFNDLCYQLTSQLKSDYPYIKRIYVRAQFPDINDDYRAYLLKSYEDTYYPENMINAGKAAYIERNQRMIDNSKFCIIYYDEKYTPPTRKKINPTASNPKSGTKIAYDYALRKRRTIINVFNEINQAPESNDTTT